MASKKYVVSAHRKLTDILESNELRWKFGKRIRYNPEFKSVDEGISICDELFKENNFAECFDAMESLLISFPENYLVILDKVYEFYLKLPVNSRFLEYQQRYFDFGITPESKVLEIGFRKSGFPFATHFLDLAGKYKPDLFSELSVSYGSVEKIPFDENEFDFVYCIDSLNSCNNPDAACKEIIRVGKRGYIETPNKYKDFLFNNIAADNHRWYIENIDNKLVFTEHSDRDKGLVCQLIKDIYSRPQTPRGKALSALINLRAKIFNTMLLWQDSFDFEVIPLPDELRKAYVSSIESSKKIKEPDQSVVKLVDKLKVIIDSQETPPERSSGEKKNSEQSDAVIPAARTKTKMHNKEYLLSAIIIFDDKKADFPAEAYKKLSQQSLFEKGCLELIFVSIGSKGVSFADFCSDDKHLQLINAPMSNPVAAMNAAVEIASAPYLTLYSENVEHRTDAYSDMLGYLDDNQGCVLVYSDNNDTSEMNEDSEKLNMRWKMLMHGLSGSVYMWRRSVHAYYGLFKESYPLTFFTEFFIRIGSAGSVCNLAKDVVISSIKKDVVVSSTKKDVVSSSIKKDVVVSSTKKDDSNNAANKNPEESTELSAELYRLFKDCTSNYKLSVLMGYEKPFMLDEYMYPVYANNFAAKYAKNAKLFGYKIQFAGLLEMLVAALESSSEREVIIQNIYVLLKNFADKNTLEEFTRQLKENAAFDLPRDNEPDDYQLLTIPYDNYIDTSIIFTAKNHLSQTKEALDSIFKTKGMNKIEVFVVNIESADGTSEYLASLGKKIKIINCSDINNFGTAVEQALDSAKGIFTVFMDNSTIPLPGWLDAIADAFAADDALAVQGARLISRDNAVFHAGMIYDDSTKSWINVSSELFDDDSIFYTERKVQAVNPAFFAVRRNVLDEFIDKYALPVSSYGLFDFFMSLESRYVIIYNPEIVLYKEPQPEQPLTADPSDTSILNSFRDKWSNIIDFKAAELLSKYLKKDDFENSLKDDSKNHKDNIKNHDKYNIKNHKEDIKNYEKSDKSKQQNATVNKTRIIDDHQPAIMDYSRASTLHIALGDDLLTALVAAALIKEIKSRHTQLKISLGGEVEVVQMFADNENIEHIADRYSRYEMLLETASDLTLDLSEICASQSPLSEAIRSISNVSKIDLQQQNIDRLIKIVSSGISPDKYSVPDEWSTMTTK